MIGIAAHPAREAGLTKRSRPAVMPRVAALAGTLHVLCWASGASAQTKASEGQAAAQVTIVKAIKSCFSSSVPVTGFLVARREAVVQLAPGDKVTEVERTAISDEIAALKTAVEASEPDAEDIKAKTQTLMEASMKLGQAMYEAQQADAANADAAADAARDGDIVDADHEEVNDEDDRKKSA